MNNTWAYLIILPIVFSLIYLFATSPLRGAMYVIAFQKIIDILWFVRIDIGPFALSVQRIAYTVIPIVLLGVVATESRRGKNLVKIPSLKYLIFIYLIIFAISVLRSPFTDKAIEFFFKSFAGLIVFFAGWYYFDNEEKFDEFANLYIVTYLIPFIGLVLQFTGVFQLSDIGITQQLESTYGIEDMTARYPGLYNDSGTNTMYLWALIPLSLYFYDKKKRKLKWIYIIFIAIAIFSVIIGFGRAAYLTFGVVVICWLFINNKYVVSFFVIISISIFFVISDFFVNFFSDLIHFYRTGKFLSVSGKAQMWDIMTEDFEKWNLVDKLFGKGLLSDTALLMKEYCVSSPVYAESNWHSYKYGMGYLGWLLYIGIPIIAMFIILKNIRIAKASCFDQRLLSKYTAWFAILCGYFVSLYGRGDQWVSVTMPLWFLAGFALKHPAFYILQGHIRKTDQESFDK